MTFASLYRFSKRCFLAAKGYLLLFMDLLAFQKANKSNTDFPITHIYPCVMDRFSESGVINTQYFYQDLHVAKLIFQNKPQKHVDIGSRVDGFITHVAVFQTLEVFDIRPNSKLDDNIVFKVVDLMNSNIVLNSYCDSISCLHTIEHFGLGRYGDPIDPEGHLKGLANITKILKPGGTFYFSTQIGPQRVEFNAHRVFSMRYLLDWLEPNYTIKSFAVIKDDGKFIANAPLSKENIDNNFCSKLGCGIFELIRKN